MNTASSQISKASPADVMELVTLVNSAYRGESSKKGWTTEADLLDGQRTDTQSMMELMQKPGSVILKHVNETGAIDACVNLQQQEDKIYLGMLTVSPELQGSGIGKQMLKASEEYAKEKGFKGICMSVISVRSELIAWYERHGYRSTGQTKAFPAGDPRFGLPKQFLEFIIMEKMF